MRKLKLGKKGLSPLVAVIVLLTLVMVLGAIIAGTLSGAPRPVLPATTAVNITAPKGANPSAGDQTLILRHEYGKPIAEAWSTNMEKDVNWGTMVMMVNDRVVDAKVDSSKIFTGTHATLTTGTEGVNQIHYESIGFAVGNKIAVEYIYENSPDVPLGISVSFAVPPGEPQLPTAEINWLHISVTLATDSENAVISTTEDVANEINANSTANQVVVASVIDSEGIVDPMSLTNLSGGVDPELGPFDFELGDMLTIDLETPLESGDMIQLIWEPRDLMLVEYLVQ